MSGVKFDGLLARREPFDDNERAQIREMLHHYQTNYQDGEDILRAHGLDGLAKIVQSLRTIALTAGAVIALGGAFTVLQGWAG